MLDLYLA